MKIRRNYNDLSKDEKKEIDMLLEQIFAELINQDRIHDIAEFDEEGYALFKVDFKNSEVICKISIDDIQKTISGAE